MFYAKGFVSKDKRYCTMMGGLKCLPFFSSPDKKYKEEVLGVKWVSDNAAWVKGNRFLLGNVGDESMTCPNTFSYNPDLIDCLLDETNTDSCDEHV